MFKDKDRIIQKTNPLGKGFEGEIVHIHYGMAWINMKPTGHEVVNLEYLKKNYELVSDREIREAASTIEVTMEYASEFKKIFAPPVFKVFIDINQWPHFYVTVAAGDKLKSVGPVPKDFSTERCKHLIKMLEEQL